MCDISKVFGVLTFATGSFDLADNGFMNMMFGPVISKPLVQSLFACASLGFFLGNKWFKNTNLNSSHFDINSLVVSFMSYISNDSPENAEKLCEYLENPNKDAVANETVITEDLNEQHKGN